MRTGRAAAAGAGVLALLLLVPACGSDVDEPAAAPAAPEISAYSVYGRHSAVRGKVDLRLANRGPDVVQVERFQVRSPLFAEVAPYERPSELLADGEESIVPVPFGSPRCEVQDGAAAQAGAVLALVVRSGNQLREVTVPLVDREPGLVRAHRTACAIAAVTGTAAVELTGPWTRDPADPRRLLGRLRLGRTAPGRLAVVEVGSNILFSVRSASRRPLLVLEDGAQEASADLVLLATRCDQHALIESKTSFTFPVPATLAGREPTALQIRADEEGTAALQSLLDDTCGAR